VLGSKESSTSQPQPGKERAVARTRRTLSFKEAKEVLERAHRTTNFDHSLGCDAVTWELEGRVIATGYFSRFPSTEINFFEGRWYLATTVEGATADRLRVFCKTSEVLANNDPGNGLDDGYDSLVLSSDAYRYGGDEEY